MDIISTAISTASTVQAARQPISSSQTLAMMIVMIVPTRRISGSKSTRIEARALSPPGSHDFPKFRKLLFSADCHAPIAGLLAAGSSHDLRVGQFVEVYSKSGGQWVTGVPQLSSM